MIGKNRHDRRLDPLGREEVERKERRLARFSEQFRAADERCRIRAGSEQLVVAQAACENRNVIRLHRETKREIDN